MSTTRATHSSIRIFKSDLLERLTHVHPITPLVVWVPVIAFLYWRAAATDLSGVQIGALSVFGFGVWTLTEYALHRWVFHFQPRGPITQRLQFLIHGLHHDDPQDPTRLVMPPVAAILLASVLYGLFWAILGPIRVEPFFGAFLVGYLCYDYTHFSVHHFTPRTRVGRYLKQSHMLHHYAKSHSRWGVSSPLWDFVFGTLRDRSESRE